MRAFAALTSAAVIFAAAGDAGISAAAVNATAYNDAVLRFAVMVIVKGGLIISLALAACSSSGVQADAAATGGASGAAGTGGMAALGGTGGTGGVAGTGGMGGVAGTGGTGDGGMGDGGMGGGGMGGGGPSCAAPPTRCGYGSGSCTITEPVAPSSLPPEVTTCNTDPTADECGCNDRMCTAGETCTKAIKFIGGGPDFYANTCITPCVATTDCGPGNACLPDVFGSFECRPRQCVSDADCARDGCGHCVAGFRTSHAIGTVAVPTVHVCVYEGACAEGSCSGCVAASGYASTDMSQLAFHSCPGS